MSVVIEDCANANAQELALPDGIDLRVVVVGAEDNDDEFFSGLRGRFPDLGIIALTPSDFSRIKESSLVAGADASVSRNRIRIELIPAIMALVSPHPKLVRRLDITGTL